MRGDLETGYAIIDSLSWAFFLNGNDRGIDIVELSQDLISLIVPPIRIKFVISSNGIFLLLNTQNADPFPNPLEERLADFIFQTLDLHANGGLRTVNLSARPGKSLGISHGNKCFKKIDLKVHNDHRI